MPAVLPPCGDDAILHRAFMDSGPFLSLAPSVDLYCPPLKRLRVTAPFVVPRAPAIELAKRSCSMDALPDECLFEILRRIGDGQERSVAACVSRRWLMLLSSIRRSDTSRRICLPDLNEDPGSDEHRSTAMPRIDRCLEGKDANDAKLAAIAIGSGGELGKLSMRSTSSPCLVTDMGLKAVGRSCSSLRSLVIWDAPGIGDDGLIEIAEGCPLLEKLDLCHCSSISNIGLAAIAESCPNLVSLSIESCPRIGDKALQAIGQLCSKLQSVCISSCPSVSDRGVSSLVSAASPSMKKLTLQNLNITDVSLGVIGYYGKEITEIVFSNLANAGGRGFWVMGSACGLQKLSTFMVSSCDGLTDMALEAIAKACPLLRQLAVRRNPCITDSGLNAFSHAAPSLEHLRLDECGKITMAGLIATLLNCQAKLRVLSVSKCAAIARVPSCRFPNASCDSLRSLTVRNCPGFGDACLAILAKFCPKLQQLDLRGHSGITSSGLLELIRHGEPGLVKVNLNGCSSITDAVVSALVKIHGRTLEALSLEGCRRITDESLAVIASGCYVLKSLDVSYSAISDGGIFTLSAGKQLNLNVFSLARCSKISNHSLEHLASFGRSLIGLNLQNCSMISPSSIVSLEEKMWWCDILF